LPNTSREQRYPGSSKPSILPVLAVKKPLLVALPGGLTKRVKA
jgi:hypothetical protein